MYIINAYEVFYFQCRILVGLVTGLDFIFVNVVGLEICQNRIYSEIIQNEMPDSMLNDLLLVDSRLPITGCQVHSMNYDFLQHNCLLDFLGDIDTSVILENEREVVSLDLSYYTCPVQSSLFQLTVNGLQITRECQCSSYCSIHSLTLQLNRKDYSLPKTHNFVFIIVTFTT